MATIALLTDFGDADGFVGMMKGTILKIAPQCQIIDMTHNVESFNIKAGAFLLQKSAKYYPQGTVFVAVVDPGVGSTRKIIAAQAGMYSFVAPNNGIVSYALSDFDNRQVFAVENENYFVRNPCQTFHGRDIMAPVAAHLANGVRLSELGPKLDSYCYLEMPNLLKHSRSVIGEIVYVDKFGNMISNIAREDLPHNVEMSLLSCTVDNTEGIRFVDSYCTGKDLSAIISGFGTVEIFINQGSAASRFAQPVGTTIAVEG